MILLNGSEASFLSWLTDFNPHIYFMDFKDNDAELFRGVTPDSENSTGTSNSSVKYNEFKNELTNSEKAISDNYFEASQQVNFSTPGDREKSSTDEATSQTDETEESLSPVVSRTASEKKWRKLLRWFFFSPWYLFKGIWRIIQIFFRGLAWCFRGGLRLIGFQRIDRYILNKYLSTYFFLLVLIITIAIIFDFNENIDKITNGGAKWTEIIFDYYANFAPYFANMFSPLFVFIAVIFFTTNLANHSEIIAMKSTGMSFRRLLRPYMFGATFIAGITFALGAYVIPKGNVARVNFSNKYIKKQLVIDEADNVQMQVDTGVVAYISHFDNRTKSGSGFSLDKFSEKKLVSRLTAQTIQYDTLADHKYSWTLHGYMIRTLTGTKEKIKSGDKLDTTIVMEPKDFFFIRGQQETMTVPELDAFIERQRLRGAAGLNTFEVEYHKRFASPFAAFILTLIGASISVQKRKGGMGTSIGLGLALTFTYILLQTISSSFATNAGMVAWLAVWLPNILYTFIAFWFYRRTPQ